MDKNHILRRLRDNEQNLRARGVSRVALFGSRARGDLHDNSDTDIMIEIDPSAAIGVYEYVAIKEYIAGLFDGPIDVVNRDGLKPFVRPAALADVVYAFLINRLRTAGLTILCIISPWRKHSSMI